MALMCVEGCLAVLNGEQWPYVADKKVYEHKKMEKMNKKGVIKWNIKKFISWNCAYHFSIIYLVLTSQIKNLVD